ncbi:kinase [Micromonospora sp. CPCC 206171]|uniref:phosphotransferase-like protein n=1 Tax=Micromonospora sp. CPCC 206171 TaxID=3122405 RepID=UPI002FEEB7E6
MMRQAMVLYGPPASGKDTITCALRELDSRYQLFQRLKAGPGRVEGYRLTSRRHLETMKAAGLLLWENARYGAIYAVDRPALEGCMESGIPVVHLGQVAAVSAITRGIPHVSWLVVELRCPRDIAAKRIAERATGDTRARLEAWDETEPLPYADLVIDTSFTTPMDAARQVRQKMLSRVRDRLWPE